MRLTWLPPVALCLAMVLAGCGTPGAPQPPSLELPRPVRDLSAARKGDRVTLTWTPSRENTDHSRVKHPGKTVICRGVDAVAMLGCRQTVGEVAPAQLPATGAATFTDVLPAALQQQNPSGFAAYAVESENPRRRSAGLGNQVRVPLAPTLPPPQALEAKVTADGVVIRWAIPPDEALSLQTRSGPLHYEFRLLRRDQAAPTAPPVEVPTAGVSASPVTILDRTAEWEHTYLYWADVRSSVLQDGKTMAEVEGEDSPPVEVFVHDVFPPAAPAGLQAVFSGLEERKFIDLIWNPSPEPDLAGYNVYRSVGGGPAQKINSALVKTPAYRDSDVQSGQTCIYSVTAVDLRGNESARSAPASESAP